MSKRVLAILVAIVVIVVVGMVLTVKHSLKASTAMDPGAAAPR